MRALCVGCRSQPLQRGCLLGPGCLSNWSHTAGHVGGRPASSDVSMDGGQSSRWHVQIGVGGWMKHARESQHGHMSALLIMTSFQLEFIMHSLFCCQHSERTWVERIGNTESSNGFLTLVNAAGSGWCFLLFFFKAGSVLAILCSLSLSVILTCLHDQCPDL